MGSVERNTGQVMRKNTPDFDCLILCVAYFAKIIATAKMPRVVFETRYICVLENLAT